MDIIEIITKKKKGKSLSQQEIDFFIKDFCGEKIADYQAAALLMAVCLKGMDGQETFFLTKAMTKSGKIADLSAIKGVKVDKHSTGGVGDGVTLVLAPALACCGVKVAKLSGRGLSFTGGTVDKLESIPNLRTDFCQEEFREIVERVGLCVASQSGELAPADKKLYALRDVTGTVDSIPLIASSIMSKKLACGADVLLLDVKYGNGAFMKTKSSALKLAKSMVEIGLKEGIKTAAVITGMEQPLAQKIGNSLEIMGAIEVLKGARNRLYEEVCILGGYILDMALNCGKEKGIDLIKDALLSGAAYDKFLTMVKSQGGDVGYVENPEKLPLGEKIEIFSLKSGYLSAVKTQQIGLTLVNLGGGRKFKEDKIDSGVGIELYVQLGDKVEKGQKLAAMYHNGKNTQQCLKDLSDSLIISSKKPSLQKDIYAFVDAKGITYL